MARNYSIEELENEATRIEEAIKSEMSRPDGYNQSIIDGLYQDLDNINYMLEIKYATQGLG